MAGCPPRRQRIKPMNFPDLQTFIRFLEQNGELHRITETVDSELEITEIATRAIKENKPALLFENVRSSTFPLVINLFGSAKRTEIALGRPPDEIGKDLVTFAEDINPPTLKAFWKNRKMAWRMISTRPKRQRRAPVQEIVETGNLDTMPILKCWPEDGGRFITLPTVFSHDPVTKKRNLGIYRMQVFDNRTTGMHMQIQKGGGFHHQLAEKRGIPLQMAAVLGGDPALTIAAVMPLPEGLDELSFLGLIRGSRTHMTRGKSIDFFIPSNAEFVLEGYVEPNSRRLEGPFGDHYGHYSEAEDFPVFTITQITRRRSPIYPATVVGKPPQEDKYLGEATQSILGPLSRLIHKEIIDIWAYFETGFHNLLVVSVDTRYTREHLKTAFGLLGTGQLSLSKVLVLVGPFVNPRDSSAVLQAIRRNFSPERHFHLIPRTSADTLDFTGGALHHGSKMIIDATGHDGYIQNISDLSLPRKGSTLASGITRYRLVGQTILAVHVSDQPRKVLRELMNNPLLRELRMIIALSSDVDLDDDTALMWGIFTRFDCAKDIIFHKTTLQGIEPIYEGTMAIDATWKHGYPKPLEMDPNITRKVENKWPVYWK